QQVSASRAWTRNRRCPDVEALRRLPPRTRPHTRRAAQRTACSWPASLRTPEQAVSVFGWGHSRPKQKPRQRAADGTDERAHHGLVAAAEQQVRLGREVARRSDPNRSEGEADQDGFKEHALPRSTRVKLSLLAGWTCPEPAPAHYRGSNTALSWSSPDDQRQAERVRGQPRDAVAHPPHRVHHALVRAVAVRQRRPSHRRACAPRVVLEQVPPPARPGSHLAPDPRAPTAAPGLRDREHERVERRLGAA